MFYFSRRDGDVRKICISVNPATLLQRGYVLFPPTHYVHDKISFSWRIVEHTLETGRKSFLLFSPETNSIYRTIGSLRFAF